MICGGNLRKKGLIDEEIYGISSKLIPNLNRFKNEQDRRDYEEYYGFQNKNNTNFDEILNLNDKERRKIIRTNSFKNNDRSNFGETIKKGILKRAASFRIKNVNDDNNNNNKNHQNLANKGILKFFDRKHHQNDNSKDDIKIDDNSNKMGALRRAISFKIKNYDQDNLNDNIIRCHSFINHNQIQNRGVVRRESMNCNYSRNLSMNEQQNGFMRTSFIKNDEFIRTDSCIRKEIVSEKNGTLLLHNPFIVRRENEICNEQNRLSRMSSFENYKNQENYPRSSTPSNCSSHGDEMENEDEIKEEIEGSLRARIYRRRHTVVIVCRNQGLDKVGSSNVQGRTGVEVQMRPLSSDLNPPRMDCYRFSMVNMEDSQDVDLEAILGELNALDSQFEEALQSAKNGDIESTKEEVTSSVQTGASARTHSPDNDSAFSDCVSLLSSESSASSGRSTTDSHCPAEQISNSKAEKIKLALQKMKEASVKKLFVKVFNDDGSAKCLLVDEGMTCGYVTRILAEKNHTSYTPSAALVEHLTDLHMKRVYEDDELLVDQLMEWTRDSKNRLIFSPSGPEAVARQLLFSRPQLVLHNEADSELDMRHPYTILEELFASNSIPKVEGPLYIKTDSKKGWKKHHCILRASGLYFYPKDRAKSSSKELVCLATFENNQVYYGVGWKKKYKAPTDHCFALKHPTIQQLTNKSSKYIKYLSAEDETTLERWVIAIRVIKRGRQLLINHKNVMEQAYGVVDPSNTSSIPQDRTSVCVTDRSSGEFITRDRSSCGSNGIESDSGSSSGCDMAFEADFPQGTIKRKPPKLPLTATTRQLKEIAIGTPVLEEERCIDECEGLPPPPPELLEPPSMEYPEPPPPPPPPRTQPRQSQIFLQDLARVMSKKWQVAQKCKMEEGTSPHEVLGFRDPDDYAIKENSVSQWVAEHYGTTLPNPDRFSTSEFGSQEFPAPPEHFMAPSLYENVYRAAPTGVRPPAQRRPPPPPPRAITTHLTTVALHHTS